jgi:hypothetical protein
MFFYFLLAALNKFVKAAKWRFYTKKSIFRNFYLWKFIANWDYFLVHLKEEKKPFKKKYFSSPEST